MMHGVKKLVSKTKATKNFNENGSRNLFVMQIFGRPVSEKTSTLFPAKIGGDFAPGGGFPFEDRVGIVVGAEPI